MLRIGVRSLSNEGYVLLQSDFSLADVVGITVGIAWHSSGRNKCHRENKYIYLVFKVSIHLNHPYI